MTIGQEKGSKRALERCSQAMSQWRGSRQRKRRPEGGRQGGEEVETEVEAEAEVVVVSLQLVVSLGMEEAKSKSLHQGLLQ